MDLKEIFKAYDVRGAYPQKLNEEIARGIGRGAAVFLGARQMLVGHDMRRSGPPLAWALMDGLRAQGVDVTFIGQASSPLVYFAGRTFDGSVSVTASHNPPPDNGMKICATGALPIGSANGLLDIRKIVEEERFPLSDKKGTIVEAAPRREFVNFSAEALHARRRFRVVVDAGNGMGGEDYAELARRDLPLDIVPMYFEPDDTFPHHEPNPIHYETLADLQKRVVAEKADFGVGLDGDADRCVFVDEKGEILPADLVTALVARDVLRDKPGAKILHDLRASRVVREQVESAGGKAVECRVGHAFIKKALRDEGGVFAGELSGHFYFEESSYAENTLIAVCRIANILDQAGQPLSALIAPLRRYHGSGEVNSRVADPAAVLSRLAEKYRDGQASHLDGLKVSFPEWWFNVRPSNTEPVVRLVVEADTRELMERKRDELLALIRS
ncbi:MAG: phosphomannomutase/phosphoglucomutase [Acidobacteria bacterium]|nr:phosphomannomutase/phosphoglucomutase [Acidobacteriota bacterium]